MTDTTAFQEDFAAGFCDAAPIGYDFEADVAASTPWCAPWHWADASEWLVDDITPYAMGRRWAEACREELQALLEEEEA